MEGLVGVIVGAAVFYVWIWRRFRNVGGYWKYQQRMREVEQGLRDARAGADGPSPFRVATGHDAALLEALRMLDSQQEALMADGYRMLGSLIAEREGAPVMASWVLVSGAGTTVATLSVALKSRRTYVALGSYDGDRHVSTVRGEAPALARPPFVDVTYLPGDTSIAKLLAAHVPPAGALVVASLDDVLARVRDLRERTQAWRAAQSPDELLDADLRALLGKAYDKRGKVWAAKLRDKLPQATARRV